ncbi:MAG: hypothetical protein Q7W13_15690, partial [Bacteroidia bacterium]|nr:hypothetical protein [Bacteroidia bacterium]
GAGKVLTSDATGLATWVTPTVGTVTSVTGTAPIVSSGGTTPAISITQSGTAANGYLSSTDWNTFNNKVAGSGTLNYIPKWTPNGTTLGNSLIFDNGTNVGIGTAAPAGKLDVNGTVVISNSGSTTLQSGESGLWMHAGTGNLYLADARDWDRYLGLTYTPGVTAAQSGVFTIGQVNKNSLTFTHGVTNFYTNGVERVRINNVGNVGIGTATPTFKLHVPAGYIGTDYINTTDNGFTGTAQAVSGIVVKSGDNYHRTSNAASVLTFLGITAPNGDNLGNHTATTTLNMNANTITNIGEAYNNGWFRNNNSGIGLYNQATGNHFYSDGAYWNIGMAGGSTGLRLRNAYAGAVYGYFYADGSGIGVLHGAGGWAILAGGAVSTANTYLDFRTNSTQRMYINGAGSVGIGTITPAAKLHVAAGGQIIGTNGTTSATRTLTILNDGQAQVNFGTYPGAWTGALQIQNNDNTRFIWLSPLDNASGANARMLTNGTGLDFYTGANAYAATITSAGNVGIGTTAPGFKLHVPSGYIGTDYINTSDNAVASGVTGIMVKQGDNYHRTSNAAGVLTFLGITAPTGDNLGNHTATTTLNLAGNSITNTAEHYIDNWIRHSDSDGTYWSATGHHIYVKDANDFYLRSGSATNIGIAMANNAGSIYGYTYADASGTGILTNLRGWGLRVDNSGDAYTTRYHFAQYFNSTDNSIASGVTGVMVKQGDNYHRTATAGALATFLNTTGTWIPNNGIGDWQVASSSTGTSYNLASLELRESNFTGNGTATPPRLGFHWGGVVASQIGIESSGRMAILNNPGTGYENLIANMISAEGGFISQGNTVIDAGGGWHRSYGNTGWYNGTYGGGWYMQDATWIRGYNGKSLWMAGGLIGGDGGLTIGYGGAGSPGGGAIIAGKVGVGTSAPATSAALDVTSTSQGFLPPRMNTAQRNAIATPVAGLVIYNTTINCLEFYNGTAWVATCGSAPCSGGTQTFNYAGAITTFTVPAGCSTITIEVWGAQGGSGTGAGGLGARMKGTFTLTPGQVLKILVGGMGGAGNQGGGGGGSFVTDASNNPLVIAGGGGGGEYSGYDYGTEPGTTVTSGQNGYCGAGCPGSISGTGGSGGGGGGSCQIYGSSGAGGGGLTGNGVSCSPTCGGNSFTNGGAGGCGAGAGGAGGFGGGGGGEWVSWTGGGGGGGYSGGGGGTYYGNGGGGGSYNGGASQNNSAGVQAGNGKITITW